MKKFFCMTLILLCTASVAFADESKVATISGMIKSNLFKNQDQIKALSEDLNTTEKMALYDRYKKDQWGPFALNLLLGAGIGSFIEGDNTGGLIALVADLSGWAALIMPEVVSLYSDTKYLLEAVGYVVIIGSRIFEIVRPFWYTAKYNSTLQDSLNYLKGLSLIPHFENNKTQVAVVYTIALN